MRKLKLELDEIHVESFSVLPDSADGAGTVQGRFNQDWNTYEGNCEGDGGIGGGGGGGATTDQTCGIGPTYCCPPTWRPTCQNTCPQTCPGTCYYVGGDCLGPPKD